MGLKLKLKIYTLICAFITVSAMQADVYNLNENILNLYFNMWSYSFVALIYIPMFLYQCLNIIRTNMDINHIVRIKSKKELFNNIVIDIFLQSVEMTAVTTILSTVLYMVIIGINTSIVTHLFINSISHFLSFAMFGLCLSMTINLIDNYMISYMCTVLFIGFPFFAHSKIYAFEKLFPRIIYLFNYDIINNGICGWLKIMLKAGIFLTAVYFISMRLHNNKEVYGVIK